nr:uncharacterized mitochondrial protein AtMg00810-like [Tanacetum cinerariifolium]
MGLWYSKDTGFKLTAFSDSDHAGCLDSRKSTSGGIQFLGGDKLVDWSSKKQNCTSMSSAKADHSHLVQSSPAFAYQAHRRQISLHQRKGRKSEDGNPARANVKQALGRYIVGVVASFQRSRIHKPHAHTQAFKVNQRFIDWGDC